MQEETIIYKSDKDSTHLIIINCGAVYEHDLEGNQVLGRPAGGNIPDIPVNCGVVSRKHGRFMTNDAGCIYSDEGSMNGTFHNGVLMKPGDSVRLSDGDVMLIHGHQDGSCNLDVVLIYSQENSKGRKWSRLPLDSVAEVTIGRNEQLSLKDQSVSRRHASFFLAKKGWTVIDHFSFNGVYLNSVRIKEPVYLKKNDVVRIAGYYFVYLESELLYQADMQNICIGNDSFLPEGMMISKSLSGHTSDSVRQTGNSDKNSSDPGLSIWIEERNVWQRARKKTLLRDIRLDIPNGSMVLILGGSGAGKTTFMNAVMGYERAEGMISYNGTDIYREYERMKYEIGYVPQQDLIRMNDTVYDTLRNAARMRLPVMEEAQYRKHIDETLQLLGLEALKDSLVGKLSGGQRKRLSIAVEYIGDPSLFFLDEPDSGLDGMMARRLMENLRTIADQGRIVIVISHSPDRAADLFDQVIVLAKNSDEEGRLVFYGDPDNACRFFKVNTLEGIIGRINLPEEGGEGLADLFIRKYSGQQVLKSC